MLSAREAQMSNDFRLMLLGGPADEVREARPRWSAIGPEGMMASPPDSLPETVWLCRVEWPLGEWRVRLHSEPSRGSSAAYRLERRPDGSAETATDGAYLYRHDADAEDDSL